MPVFTVGHSNRSWGEFLDVLRAAEIRQLIDVRRFPVSRRNPQFSRDAMAPALTEAGVVYRHMPELGGYRDSQAAADSPNDGFAPGFLRNYADYAMTPAFGAALQRLRDGLVPGTAIMCAEKNWRDCHRQVIADYLLSAGYPVIHLIDGGTREQAALATSAVVQPDGTIIYRANARQLGFGF